MSDKDVEIGKRIAAERERVGMSQRDLAEMAGLSQPTVHRIETGQREASTLELSVIADACGVLIADLLGTNTLADEVRCAGRTSDAESRMMAEYLVYAFGLARRLDELEVPEVA